MGFLLAAAGGALGASSRCAVTLLMRPVSGVFPWHTLGVNVAGAYVLGSVTASLVGAAVGYAAGRAL